PDIFSALVEKISDHDIFMNNSNNPQMPVWIQLAIFLNSAGHYGNTATSQDMAEWAGVSVGTVHNCYKRVMVAILHYHDAVIHFDLAREDDRQERENSKVWVESKTCVEWRNGFLCVDGTPFNLFQKPGWHGEGFFDRKSRYSLSNQIVIFPHNLRIIDYADLVSFNAIGIPGSLHDSSAFQRTRIARHPSQFFSETEWLWADSAYPSHKWCVVPFKK
ncbi:hypothetical protein PAXINDRAFT_24245, partial [Paxillus involutus ATCC 200175]